MEISKSGSGEGPGYNGRGYSTVSPMGAVPEDCGHKCRSLLWGLHSW